MRARLVRNTVVLCSMTFFMATACKNRNANESDVSFGSGEHKWLGDKSYKNACDIAKGPCAGDRKLKRKNGKESYTYGDLVAFSGDFFSGPSDIYDKAENLLGRVNSKGYVKSHFEKQVEAINKMYHGEDGDYPHNDFKVSISIPQYGLLAMDNDSHFGWHNMVQYVKNHEMALELALAAYNLKATDLDQAKEKLNHAMFVNAFADHFLTDGFAAGHLRVPRTQIKDWAAQKKYTATLGGTISKVVHDFDGKLGKHFPEGLWVKNAAGKQWATRVDSELFKRLENDQDAVDIPVKAVELSLLEVFEVFKTGKKPEGVFAGAQLVPFADTAKEIGLSKRFENLSNNEIDDMVASKAWFSNVPFLTKVTSNHVKQLKKDLPGMMKSFAKQVTNEVNGDENISKRLPAEYIQYYKNID